MQKSMQHLQAICFATFLSPVLYKTYEYIARYVGEQMGRSTTLNIGHSLEEFASGVVDVGFLCGLQYVRMKDREDCAIELLVAPVLQGERYQHKPIYYSDVIVRKESYYSSFDDLQGCTWAYNEGVSHSGYNLVYYSLLKRNKTSHYFGKTLATGSHLRSLQAILDGEADSTAIDSHLLDTFCLQRPEIAAQIRIIDSLGPSTIPPLVVAKSLSEKTKYQIRDLLTSMHRDDHAVEILSEGHIERFMMIKDEDYDDIRMMLSQVRENLTLPG